MASSQNQRYQERLAARQRGAGTHKIQNLGFSIQPLAPPTRPAAPPSAPPVEPPKQVRLAGTPVQRSPRTTPTPPPLPLHSSGDKRKAGPSSLRNEVVATDSQETPTVAPPRRISPRTQIAPAAVLPRSADTPTHITASKASTRTTSARPAVAAVTPIPRGKRTRQPSPGKFVNTPEEQVRRNGKGSSAVVHEVVESEASVIIEKSPGGNKRRRIVKEIDATLEVAVEEEDEEMIGGQTVELSTTGEAEETEMGAEEEEAAADETLLETPPLKGLGKTQAPPNSSPPLFLNSSGSSPDREEEEQEPTPRANSVPRGKRAPSLPEPEEEELDEYLQQESPEKYQEQELSDEVSEDEPPAPRVAKKASKASKPSIAAHLKPKPKPHRDADDDEAGPTTFPVVVHRLAKGQGTTKLPAGSQRSAVNPVDVISQVATELIDKLYQKLKSGTEKKAVESFKEELSLRFLELTDALEHSITLTTQVRKAQKRKNQLIAELLAIKRERTQVSASMDDVRREHEIASKSGDSQHQVSQIFEEISGALERGKPRSKKVDGDLDTAMEGLEGLVKKVSAIVTGGGRDGTGILGKVIEFNRFLEKAEQVLRERNVTAAAR